jgi:hypothetical protein
MESDELGSDQVTPVPGFEQESANGDAPSPFSEASIADLLQADMAELAATKEVFIPIKGYERSGIQACYHLPAKGKELNDIGRKVEREFKDNYSRNLAIAIDTMIHLCSGIYCQPEGVPEPVMLDPDNTGAPVGFDQDLAKLMGIEGETQSARQVVRRLFNNNDLAIISHAEKLQRWLQNTKADVSLEIWQQGE